MKILCSFVIFLLLAVVVSAFDLIDNPTNFYDAAERDMKKEPIPLNLPASVLGNLNNENRNAGAGAGFNKIRIVTSTLDLDDTDKYCTASGESRPDFLGSTITCTTDHVLTTDKKTRLTTLLAEAVDLYTNALSVDSLGSNLLVGSTNQCPYWTIPSAHVSTGVANADFVLYVAAGPAIDNRLGFAAGCQLTSDKRRQIVGKVNINPKYLDSSNERNMRRTLAHELYHALGFVNARFNDFNFLKSFNFRGRVKQAIVSPKALMTARNFFNCPDLEGVELEDEGGSGTANNHLESRIYHNDLLAGLDFRFLSTIDLAIFEDMGVYKVNYSVAEPVTFGKNMGCGFLRDSCSTTSGGFGKYWCTSGSSGNGCAPDLRGYGSCDTYGILGDGCYAYLDDSKVCADLPGGSTTHDVDTGESYGVESRCLMTENSFKLTGSSTSVTATSPRCFDVRCSETNSSLLFRVANQADDSTWQECTTDEATVSVSGYDGNVICPKSLADYCRSINTTGDLADIPSVTSFTVFPKNLDSGAGNLFDGGAKYVLTLISMILVVLLL